MQSDLPKVLHSLAGRPLLSHVLATVHALNPARVRVVCGHGSEAVKAAAADYAVEWVTQAKQAGTGHAVQQALPRIAPDTLVLVVYGDVPLVQAETLRALVSGAQDGLALLTAKLQDPYGYGRILRGGDDRIVGVVEERDANAAQRAIKEINTGLLAVRAGFLKSWLGRIKDDNEQGEYYLTDVVALACAEGVPVRGLQAPTCEEILGINCRQDLATLERAYQYRQAQALMNRGVTVIDPGRLDIRGTVQSGRDCVVDVNVVLEGSVTLGDRVVIGPNNVIRDTTIGQGVVVHPSCVIENAVIGAGSRIGPFARIRPGSVIGEQAHIGNFVEIKNSEIRPASKVNHLSYVGDSYVGANTNIGAGVITCNYDGAQKHRTEIGDDVFVGSNCQLVAPVKIARGATIGAGSTITNDVPEGALAVARARQKNLKGWRRPKKR